MGQGCSLVRRTGDTERAPAARPPCIVAGVSAWVTPRCKMPPVRKHAPRPAIRESQPASPGTARIARRIPEQFLPPGLLQTSLRSEDHDFRVLILSRFSISDSCETRREYSPFWGPRHQPSIHCAPALEVHAPVSGSSRCAVGTCQATEHSQGRERGRLSGAPAGCYGTQRLVSHPGTGVGHEAGKRGRGTRLPCPVLIPSTLVKPIAWVESRRLGTPIPEVGFDDVPCPRHADASFSEETPAGSAGTCPGGRGSLTASCSDRLDWRNFQGDLPRRGRVSRRRGHPPSAGVFAVVYPKPGHSNHRSAGSLTPPTGYLLSFPRRETCTLLRACRWPKPRDRLLGSRGPDATRRLYRDPGTAAGQDPQEAPDGFLPPTGELGELLATRTGVGVSRRGHLRAWRVSKLEASPREGGGGGGADSKMPPGALAHGRWESPGQGSEGRASPELRAFDPTSAAKIDSPQVGFEQWSPLGFSSRSTATDSQGRVGNPAVFRP